METLVVWGQGAVLLYLSFLPVAEVARQSQAVPFTLHRGHLVLVRGEIGRLTDLNVAVDTGSSRTIISTSVADRLGLRGTASSFESMGQHLNAIEAVIPAFRAGGLALFGERVLVHDLASTAAALGMTRLDAIVGMDLLRRRSFSIDFVSRRLVVASASKTHHSAPFLDHPLFAVVGAAVDGRRVRLVVDTGASHLVMFRADSSAPGATATHLGGTVPLIATRFADVRIGSWRGEDVAGLIAPAAGAATMGADGLLGLPALNASYVQFDFERRTLGWRR